MSKVIAVITPNSKLFYQWIKEIGKDEYEEGTAFMFVYCGNQLLNVNIDGFVLGYGASAVKDLNDLIFRANIQVSK